MNDRIKYWIRAIDEETERLDGMWIGRRIVSMPFRSMLVDLRTALYAIENAPKPVDDVIVPAFSPDPVEPQSETIPDRRPTKRRVVKRES